MSAEARCAQALRASGCQFKLESEYHFRHEFAVEFRRSQGQRHLLFPIHDWTEEKEKKRTTMGAAFGIRLRE